MDEGRKIKSTQSETHQSSAAMRNNSFNGEGSDPLPQTGRGGGNQAILSEDVKRRRFWKSPSTNPEPSNISYELTE